jgi:DNA-binding response OmpR family regulator
MTASVERILLVESDPAISEWIARQALLPLGCEVNIIRDAENAIGQARQFAPDVVIANLNLPGLSGKDLVTALNSQGITAPVIVIAEKGNEYSVVEAFRLGAMDYLPWSAREAEVVTVVERALKQVRENRFRQQLEQQVGETGEELQRRSRALNTLFAIGREVASAAKLHGLLNKIVGGAVYASKADYGWLMLREEKTHAFLLRAQRNLPEAWSEKVGQPFMDGISSLAAISGEPLAINGEPLQGFLVAQLGQAVMVTPVKVQQEVVGLLVMLRKANQPFERDVQFFLGAIADYTAIALVNDQFSRRLQATSEAAQGEEKRKSEKPQILHEEIQNHLQLITYPIELLLAGKMGILTDEQQLALSTMQIALRRTLQMVATKEASNQK